MPNIVQIDGTSTTFNASSGSAPNLIFSSLAGPPPEGSFILVTIASTGGTNRSFTTPDTDWVLIGRKDNGTNPANGTYYKIAGPNEPSSYTFTVDTAAASSAGCIAVLLGVDQNNPISGVFGNNGVTSSTIVFGTFATTSSYGQIFKTVAARNTSSPPELLDAGPNSTVLAWDSNTSGTCMMSGLMSDVEIASPGTYSPEDATMDVSCTKACVSFVINGAVSPPVAWMGG